MKTIVNLGFVVAMTAVLGGCGATAPAGTTAAGPGGVASAPVVAAQSGAASVQAESTAGEADPCQLVTRTEAEAQAGGTVTVETGALPGPPGEGGFCRYTSANLEELEIRTAVGRGDYDNDRKLATGNDWDVADAPGVGDEAWTDKGPFLGSINVISHGTWVRISASLGFGAKPMLALPDLAKQAIGRLP